jgi:hypothetical protein
MSIQSSIAIKYFNYCCQRLLESIDKQMKEGYHEHEILYNLISDELEKTKKAEAGWE